MQRLAYALVLAMSTTAGTTIAGEADKAPAPEDRYIWLEDVTADKSLEWARARNAESAKVLGTPEEAALEKRLLDILDSKERIPAVAEARRPGTTTSGRTPRTRAACGGGRRSPSTASPSPPGRR